MVSPLPINNSEFSRLLQKCRPPVGWFEKIAVANSGGPDSTCLLFLLHRYLAGKHQVQQTAYPLNVFSLHVDHDLQPASSTMAEHCSNFARSLKVEHTTTKISWSQPPFPLRPLPGEAVEGTARPARYRALYDAMTEKKLKVIAFAHHADDQYETSLVRLSFGSTSLGASGMRLCRRWGMGLNKATEQGEYGLEGMNRWIVRPLLSVDKDRILATCEGHKLDYVTDSTNFQPDLTIRNAIRFELSDEKKPTTISVYPPKIADRLTALEDVMHKYNVSFDSSREELRKAMAGLTTRVRDIERRADIAMKYFCFPAVPGTLLFPTPAIHRIRDHVIRRILIIRASRYASCYAWGSLRADLGLRSDNISEVADRLWKPLTWNSQLRTFTVGGGVMWSPVMIRPDGSIGTPKGVAINALPPNIDVGWIVSRQPPLHREKLKTLGLPNTLEIDVTETITHALRNLEKSSNGTSIVPILYDQRFLVQFNLEKMPHTLVSRLLDRTNSERIWLLPHSRWFLPNVVLEGRDYSETLQNKISVDADYTFHKRLAGNPSYRGRHNENIDSGWITIDWIRPLTYI